MSHDIWVEGRETPVHAAVLIFYDRATNKFLLEERSKGNPVLGGEVVFPSEKGGGMGTIETAKRGVREEMGDGVRIKKLTRLQPFSGQVGDMGEGTIQGYVISEWEGEIRNIEPWKSKHVWAERKEVMERLTNEQSKLLCLLALMSLKLIEPSDFESAPKIVEQTS